MTDPFDVVEKAVICRGAGHLCCLAGGVGIEALEALTTIKEDLALSALAGKADQARIRELERELGITAEELPSYLKVKEQEARIANLEKALQEALDHLQFNKWQGDPGSNKRFAAVQSIRNALKEKP